MWTFMRNYFIRSPPNITTYFMFLWVNKLRKVDDNCICRSNERRWSSINTRMRTPSEISKNTLMKTITNKTVTIAQKVNRTPRIQRKEQKNADDNG